MRLVHSRPRMSRRGVPNSGSLISTLPFQSLVSMTHTPVGATATWSMSPRPPGIRRLCNVMTLLELVRLASESATARSASAPCSNADSCCGAPPRARTRPPIRGWVPRVRFSRLRRRRSCSRNGLPPGCPRSGGAAAGPGDEFAPTQHPVQVTVRVSLSHHAWVPAARSAPQHVHTSSRRSVSFRPATERMIGSTRTILNPLAERSTDIQRPGQWHSGRPGGCTGGALSRHGRRQTLKAVPSGDTGTDPEFRAARSRTTAKSPKRKSAVSPGE